MTHTNAYTAKQVSFQSNSIKIAANLYYPDIPDKKLLPAIVVSHPGGRVKEQTAGLYAERSYSPHLAYLIAPRPVSMIAGTAAQISWMTKEAYEWCDGKKELFFIEGVTHVTSMIKNDIFRRLFLHWINFSKRICAK